MRKTYLNRWIRKDLDENDLDVHASTEGSGFINKDNIVDFARLKVEHAALQESLANMERLTTSIHRLHVVLLKAQDDVKTAIPLDSIAEGLSSVIAEANHLRTALGSSLPVRWSADASVDAATYENLYESEERDSKVDPVSAAGFEMVELLILAAQLLMDSLGGKMMD